MPTKIEMRELGHTFLKAVEKQAQVVETVPAEAKVNLVDSRSFNEKTIKLDWLVKHVLVKGQPCIAGGAHKTLKTNIGVDLAVSLGSGKKFLGQFEIPHRVRVGFISGESGEVTIQETMRRIAKAKGVDPSSLDVFWGFELPKLSSHDHLRGLERAIQDHALEVVVIDPLYLALLAGNPTANAANVYEMGPLLAAAARVCLEAGATPVLVHHTKKAQMGRNAKYTPPQLEDLAYAGVQEFARQWLLLGRRVPFEPGSGLHELWMNIGGSTGHSGCWAVDIDEGQLDESFGGRHWQVAVRTAIEEIKQLERSRDRAKEVIQGKRLDENCEKIEQLLYKHHEGETKSVIAREAGISNARAGEVLETLVRLKKVVQTKIRKRCGNGRRSFDGFKIPNQVPEDDYEDAEPLNGDAAIAGQVVEKGIQTAVRASGATA